MAVPVGITGVGQGATTNNLTLPGTITNGSKAWVEACYDSSSSVPSTPTGWTLETTAASGSGTNAKRLYSRLVGAADQGTVHNFSKTSTGKMTLVGVVVPPDYTHASATYSTSVNTAAATSHTVPTLGSLAAGTWHVVAFFASRGSAGVTGITPPSGFTTLSSGVTTGGGASSGWATLNSTDDTDGTVGGGTVTLTGTGSNSQGMGFTILALPVAAASEQTATVTMTQSSSVAVTAGAAQTASVALSSSSSLSVTGNQTTPAAVAMTQGSSLRVEVQGPIQKLSYPAYIGHRGGASVPGPPGRPESTLFAQQELINNDHPWTILDLDACLIGPGGGATLRDRIGFTHYYDDLDGTGQNYIRDASNNVVTGTIGEHTVAEYDTWTMDVRSGITGTPRPMNRWPEFATFMKANPTRIAAVETKTADVLQPFIDNVLADDLVGQVLAHSFDYSRCTAMAAAGLNVAYLITGLTSTIANNAYAAGIRWVFGDRNTMASDYGTIAHAAGLKVGVYTVNSTANRNAAISTWGADIIITDRPDAVNLGPWSTMPMTQSSALTVAGAGSTSAAVPVVQGSTLGVGATPVRAGVVPLASTSSVGFSAALTRTAAVTTAQGSTLAVSAGVTRLAAVAAVQTSTLAVATTVVRVATVTVAQTSTMSVAAAGSQTATVALTQGSAVSVAGAVSAAGTVTLTQSSAVAVAPLRAAVASVPIAQGSTLAVSTSGSQPGTVATIQTSSLSVTATTTRSAAVTLVGTSDISAAGRVTTSSSVPVAQTSTLTVAVTHAAAVTLAQGSTLAVAASRDFTVAVALIQTSVLAVAASTSATGTIQVAQSSALSLEATAVRLLAVLLAQSSTLTVTAERGVVGPFVVSGGAARDPWMVRRGAIP